ncbi:MAG TPA: tyrosinase family protein [Solirubrobacterales bacterium]|nr:tyrosinase family protein [Solirubrobacterales bacterium]
MQSRPEREDPTSWWYQAAVHGTHAANPLKEWNQCTHFTWYFVSWHRAFLYYFEEIVRAAIGEIHGAEAAEGWALPYWNYCRGGDFSKLPDAFREAHRKDGSPNPLFIPQRDPVMNAGGTMLDEAVESDWALGRPHFIGRAEFGGKKEKIAQFGNSTSSGVLEGTPHGSVHNGVGGENGWMKDIKAAAKDPIFWLHHCNIDRIWSQWVSLGEGRENPNDPIWLEQVFEFNDAAGKVATKSSIELVDTKALDYEYDSVDGIPKAGAPKTGAPKAGATEAETAVAVPASAGQSGEGEGSSAPIQSKIVGASETKLTLSGEPAAIPVEIDARAREEVREASTVTDPRRLYLNIENIEGEANPGISYGIYVNLPKGADAKTKREHHVGNVSLFGIEHAAAPLKDEPAHSVAASVEIGALLRALGGGEQFDEEGINVTFLPLRPVPPKGREEEFSRPEEEAPPVRIGRVSLAVDS